MFKNCPYIKDVLFFAGLLISITSCEKNPDNPGGKDQKVKINLSLAVTKATESAYENGDAVGIYMVYGNLAGAGNYVNNKKFTLSGAEWKADEDIFWKDIVTKADFYCYYPFSTTVTDATKYAFSVKSDQSTEANYKASDFIWGKSSEVTPTESTVLINTAHKMSSLVVTLLPGDGFTADEFAAAQKSVSITGIKTSSEINLGTGILTATGMLGSISPYAGYGDYRALIIPQTVSATVPFLNVKVNDVPYNVSEAFTFAPGTKHNVTVKVDKTSSGLKIGIDAWTIDGTEYQFNAK